MPRRRRTSQALTAIKPEVVCHHPRLMVYTGGVPLPSRPSLPKDVTR